MNSLLSTLFSCTDPRQPRQSRPHSKGRLALSAVVTHGNQHPYISSGDKHNRSATAQVQPLSSSRGEQHPVDVGYTDTQTDILPT